MEHINEIKSEYISFKIGEQILMRIPNSQMEYVKAHILDIMNDNGDILIIFKYYSPYRKYWFYKIEGIDILDMYNKDEDIINECKKEYYAKKNKKS